MPGVGPGPRPECPPGAITARCSHAARPTHGARREGEAKREPACSTTPTLRRGSGEAHERSVEIRPVGLLVCLVFATRPLFSFDLRAKVHGRSRAPAPTIRGPESKGATCKAGQGSSRRSSRSCSRCSALRTPRLIWPADAGATAPRPSTSARCKGNRVADAGAGISVSASSVGSRPAT